MTPPEQAELRVVVRWLKALAVGILLTVFAAGVLWASFKDLPQLVAELQQDRDADRQVMRDFMLLSCARDTLNAHERTVCAMYQVRPR